MGLMKKRHKGEMKCGIWLAHEYLLVSFPLLKKNFYAGFGHFPVWNLHYFLFGPFYDFFMPPERISLQYSMQVLVSETFCLLLLCQSILGFD
jgi:hypothetical protein